MSSRKHSTFVSQPLQKKGVRNVPGIGPTLGKRLEKKGYNQASQLAGQYMASNGNNRKFKEWVQRNSYANAKQANDCCQAVRQWCDNHV